MQRHLGILLGLLSLLAGCGGDSDHRAVFVVRSTTGSASGAMAPEVQGVWIVYWARESLMAGEQLTLARNGDLDTDDEVVVVIRADAPAEFFLNVAALSAAVVGNQIFLEVSEADDGQDWDLSGFATDRVLLHWSQTTLALTYVDTLSPNLGRVPLLGTDTRLYYSADLPVAPMGDTSSLFYVDPSAPTSPVQVLTALGAGPLDPVILGEEDGLLFLALDETRELRPLNSDADSADPFILALLDSTSSTAAIVRVDLALESLLAPFDARFLGAGDWQLAFLVDEADEGGTNFNDPNLPSAPFVPASCAATPDTDSTDQVLFHTTFMDVVMGGRPPVNTGLAGRDRVLVTDHGVATLSDESAANCIFNADSDLADTVVRWAPLDVAVPLQNDPAQIYPVNTSLPGGAQGLALLHGNFIIAMDESADPRDLDMNPTPHDLLAWLDPSAGASATWTFAHQHPVNAGYGTAVFEDIDGDGLGDPYEGASLPYAGATWMAAEEQWGRLPATFEERVPGQNLNTNISCGFRSKDNDTTDALPVWLTFSAGTLDFDGLGYSVDQANAGVVVVGGFVYSRVSEPQENVDHNGDGDRNDMVLMRSSVSVCTPVIMGDASMIPGDVIESEGGLSAAFFADESQSGQDLNGDGDTTDLVIQYFLL